LYALSDDLFLFAVFSPETSIGIMAFLAL